jgi:SAM-dependent methyltransferase
MSRRTRAGSTARAWELTAREKYAPALEADIALLNDGEIALSPVERRYLSDLSVWCRRAVHLQCSHGQSTISLWMLGAHEVIGVDFSANMLALAREKSARLGAPARWIQSDVLAIPPDLDGTADLVFSGGGAICWVCDLKRWAQTIERILRPGGRLLIFDSHPLTWVWEHQARTWRLRADGGDYFWAGPRASRHFPASAVARATPPGQVPPIAWEYQWTLGAIVTSLSDTGLRLHTLGEHE